VAQQYFTSFISLYNEMSIRRPAPEFKRDAERRDGAIARCRSLATAMREANGLLGRGAYAMASGGFGQHDGVRGRTFYLGVSLFDAIGHVGPGDLDQLLRHRFNLVRVWAHWRSNSIYDENGRVVLHRSTDLIKLADDLHERGIFLDLALFSTSVPFGSDWGKWYRGAEEVTNLLRGRPGILFDLCNEHDHPGARIGHEQLAVMSQRIRSIDGQRRLTVSSCETHLLDGVRRHPCHDTFTPEGLQNLQAELCQVGVDVLSPHFLRSDAWAALTGNRIEMLRREARRLGREVPIYLQEEARRGHSGLNPSAEEFLLGATQALQHRAWGWVFHTAAGFHLKDVSFFQQLDEVENEVVTTLGSALRVENPNASGG
jgi:hypothetical protein